MYTAHLLLEIHYLSCWEYSNKLYMQDFWVQGAYLWKGEKGNKANIC